MFVVFSPTYRPNHDGRIRQHFCGAFWQPGGLCPARTALPFLISSTTPPSPVSAAPLLVLFHRLPRATLYVRATGTCLFVALCFDFAIT